MIRIFDFLFSLIGLVILFPLVLILWVIGYFDTGSPIFKQKRIGKELNPFYLYKFRTMHLNTQSLATHLVSSNSVTKYGSFLRKSKLDELPQLINVLLGDMSLVGPRPSLFNQVELMDARKRKGIYSVRPGITGLAQIRDIDMSNPEKLAEVDAIMIRKLNLKLYFKYIFLTLFGAGFGDRISRNH